MAGGEYLFGPHKGHLPPEAELIARKHGAYHVNYTEPRGEKRGWFVTQNHGHPFDGECERAVLAEIRKQPWSPWARDDDEGDASLS